MAVAEIMLSGSLNYLPLIPHFPLNSYRVLSFERINIDITKIQWRFLGRRNNLIPDQHNHAGMAVRQLRILLWNSHQPFFDVGLEFNGVHLSTPLQTGNGQSSSLSMLKVAEPGQHVLRVVDPGHLPLPDHRMG